MGYPKEKLIVMQSSPFDIGNTGANVATFVIPERCSVKRVQCYSTSAVANAFIVSLDSYDGSSQGAEDIGAITVPDSASAFRAYYDLAGEGQLLNAGELVLVQVDNAGDSGENAIVQLILEYQPEIEGNQSRLILSA